MSVGLNTVAHLCEKYRVVIAWDGIPSEHAEGELCFFKDDTFTSMLSLCNFCKDYEKTYMFLLVQNAKKIHRQKIKKVHGVIRSVPPHGVDYVKSVNTYANIMKKR